MRFVYKSVEKKRKKRNDNHKYAKIEIKLAEKKMFFFSQFQRNGKKLFFRSLAIYCVKKNGTDRHLNLNDN